MAITRIDVNQFLELAACHPVLDVRSEGEYAHAHFPGAHALPLFNNEERAIVGTAYKQESQQRAIKLGLQFFGKKMVDMVEKVEALFKKDALDKTVILYCWRGGMRSGGVAWLLDLYGFKVYTLVGGYKAFRRWCLARLERDHPIKLVGGYTGSGKTEVLHALRRRGHAVIDLEALASHKGSAFGSLGMPPQPSQEAFENALALQLWQVAAGAEQNGALPPVIWMEDESQRIGAINIPTPFFKRLKEKPLFFLEVPFEERLRHIVAGYGKCNKEALVTTILRIRKRLGGLQTRQAVNYLIEDNTTESFRILLQYYDRFYAHDVAQKPPHLLHRISCSGVDANGNAQLILQQQETTIHV